MSEVIKIVIADDFPISRKGLASMLDQYPQFSVVGEAVDGVSAMELIELEKPDIVILDVDMPNMDGIEVARQLKVKGDSTKKIFLTMHKDSLILHSLKDLGVRGYVLKESADVDIVECINEVASGGTFLSPSLKELLFDSSIETPKGGAIDAIPLLTRAERQVLKLISESMTNREIAEALFISVRTVESHRHNICSKIGVNGTNALLKFAILNKKRLRTLS